MTRASELARAAAAIAAAWRHRSATPERIRAYQDRRLRALVAHAHANVPYYRRLLDAHGVNPADIRGVADLGAIPITGRAELQLVAPGEILARGQDLARLRVRSTSGSTGRPLTIRRTGLEDRLLNAFLWRALHAYGLRTRDRLAVVHSVPRPASRPGHPPSPRRRSLARRSLPRLHHVFLVDCRQEPDAILRRLLTIRPDVIMGLPNVLLRVAGLMDGRDRQLMPLRFLSPFGEVVTPVMRRRLADGFGAPVLDTYRTHELNLVAWECPRSGELHTADDSVIVEVLRDGRPAGPGERGELVATALHAFAMPFIRYRLGDVVTRGRAACACGQPWGTIRQVQGRMIDYFVLPSGDLLHPYELVGAFMAPWVREYQLVQERRDRVVLRVVPFAPPSPEQRDDARAALARALGRDVDVEVLVVPELQLEPSGKLRPSRSLVRSEYDGIDWDRPSPVAS